MTMADKREDDITDLTGDIGDNSKGKGKKNQNNGKDKNKDKNKNKDKKKGKEPEHTSLPPANGEKPGKKGKAKGEKKKGGKLKLILIAVPVVVIAGFVAMLAFNLFGVRSIVGSAVKEPVISAVVWLDPEFKSVDDELQSKSDRLDAQFGERETQLSTREAGIAEQEAELNERKTSLDTFEAQLERRSASLDKRAEQMNQTNGTAAPIYRRDLTEQELTDMQSLSRSYAQINPATAADILTKLKDEQHVASIIYFMSERNAAAILAAMEIEFAARITDILLPG